jgi:beta-xylosidase
MKKLGAQLGIDPGFFADDDGRLYLILNKGPIYELTSDGLAIKGPVAEIDRRKYRYFEGPDIFRHNGWYYLLFSEGGTLPREPSTISTLRARALTGPWEEDPDNPNLFATDGGGRFEAPAHGTLIEAAPGRWYITYHAHETAYYTLGRQMLMQPIEWTVDGWWRPTTGKAPTATAVSPGLPGVPLKLAQSDEFERPTLGLQWFFTCAPDFSGKTWSLTERPGFLRMHAAEGDLSSIEALPAILQQRMIDKKFSVETQLTFDAREGREAAGLHFYHDPEMNLWLASTVRDGKKVLVVGKFTLGQRTELWVEPQPARSTVRLKIAVDGEERATFFVGDGALGWRQIGGKIYFGASGHHLRNGERGDPDLGWVGRYKEKDAPAEPPNPRLPDRRGNVWTAATFGVFAVRDGAAAAHDADFDYVRVSVER